MEPLPSSLDLPSEGGGPGPQLAPDTPKPSGRDTTRVAFEWIGLVVLALIIALLIKTFLFQAFFIPSESMVPTLKVHDRVLVNKLSYKLHPVHRDDIVVFKAPPDSDPGIDDLVKRVIGLPGRDASRPTAGTCTSTARSSTSRICRQGTSTSRLRGGEDTRRPLLGDGRQSRQFQGLPRASGRSRRVTIVGRVFVRIWPLHTSSAFM